MLEIVFSDSACGSLKAAQHYGQGEYQSGCIGVFVTHEDGTEATPEEIAEAQRQAEAQAQLPPAPQADGSSEGAATESADDTGPTGTDALEEAVSSEPQEAGAPDLAGDTSSQEVQG